MTRILAAMRRVLPLLLYVCCVAASVGPVAAQCGQSPDGTPAPCGTHAPSVAILFMEPRSRNAADSLLAEGLTLEIINTLSGVARLDVKSRFFSRRIAADVDPVRSARSFGVDYVVDGVLELDSARVLVRGALTRTSTGRVVRPLRIVRRRAELEGLQVTVAQEIATAVVGRLLPSERARFAVRRVDPRVTELLFSARALLQQYTVAAGRQALALARQAIAIDSTYAPSWVQLSWIYVQRGEIEPDSFDLYAEPSLAAAEHAFALDSSNGLAMTGAAWVRSYRNDLSPRTEALARRGAALEPGVQTAVDLALVLETMGKGDEALAVAREAVRRDSLSPLNWVEAAYRFRLLRHFVEAGRALERALALRPSAFDSIHLQHTRRWARLETGDCTGALVDGRSSRDQFLVIESLRCLGRTAEADSLIVSELAVSAVWPVNRAILLAWRNQPDSAFTVLDRAFPPLLGLWLNHPAFDPYRQHPGFLALRRRMGLDH
jgi:TolB-like protein/tetratricopeptide (TPR) repeat protein